MNHSEVLTKFLRPDDVKLTVPRYLFGIMGVGTGGAEGAAAPPTFGTGEQAIALAPPKV